MADFANLTEFFEFIAYNKANEIEGYDSFKFVCDEDDTDLKVIKVEWYDENGNEPIATYTIGK